MYVQEGTGMTRPDWGKDMPPLVVPVCRATKKHIYAAVDPRSNTKEERYSKNAISTTR